MRKVCFPSTTLTTSRVLKDRPSRTLATVWTVCAPGGVGRRK